MSKLLYLLARGVIKARWFVLAIWLIGGIAIIGVGAKAGTATYNDLSLPGTNSQAATDLLTKEFPPQQNGSSPIVFEVPEGRHVLDEPYKSTIIGISKAYKELPQVHSVIDPMEQHAEALRSDDGRMAYIPVLLNVDDANLEMSLAQKIYDIGAGPAKQAGMTYAVGGPVGSTLGGDTSDNADKIGMLVAMLILTITFGSLIAMGVPLLTAVFGLSISLAIITLLEHIVTIPTVAPTLATMLGLGVGIDYALFMVTRHEAQLGRGMEVRESIARTTATSGGAIVFAGGTVVIAIASLALAKIPVVTAMGYTAAIAVLVAVLGAITLVPAVFAILGTHLFALKLPKFLRPSRKDPAKTIWAKAARAIVNHPWRGITIAMLILVPLIIPVFQLEYGQPDVGVDPPDQTQRQAYDMLASGYGPGYNGPLLIAVQLPTPATASTEYVAKRSHAIKLHEDGTKLKQKGRSETAFFKRRDKVLTDKGDQLEREAAPLQAQEARLEAQGERLAAQGQALEARAASLEARKNALLAKKQRLENQAAHDEAQLRSILATAEVVFQEWLAATGARKEHLGERLEKLERRAAKNIKKLERLKQQGTRLARQGAKLERQGKHLATQGKRLEREVLRLEREGTQLEREAKPLTRKGDRLKKEGAKLKREVKREKGRKPLFRERKRRILQEGNVLKPELREMMRHAGGKRRATDGRLQILRTALVNSSGVDEVSPPSVNEAGTAAVLSVVGTGEPSSQKTNELVEVLRDTTAPEAKRRDNVEMYVGGQTASYIDLATGISHAMPVVIATVIGLSFLLLMLAFRSVLIPTKAAVMNLLSVLAAFGALTLIFQEGHGLSLIGVEGATSVPIASYVPLMMFAILFGLSMDYEVFLMGAIAEHHQEGMKHRDAIVAGLSTSSRVITAAATIMVSVFASFIIEDDPIVKQFGVGLSLAVLIDATVVRMLLVPSILELMGERAWWIPKWLDKIMPQVSLEGGPRFDAMVKEQAAKREAKASAKAGSVSEETA